MRAYVISAVTLHREGLAEVLRGRNGIEIVGTGADADALPVTLTAGTGGEQTVVVLDGAGIDVALAARRIPASSGLRVLAVNVPARERDVVACAEAGVACCLTAEASLDDLVAAITGVGRGEAPCSAWTSGVLLRRIATLARERRAPPVFEPSAPMLTGRERQILALVERGLSNKEIGRELCIELPTVKNHIHRILEKLGVHRRVDAAALARNGGVPEGRARASR